MADNTPNAEFPTIIGPDASFKGELTFEKGLRLQGKFEGRINTQGRLHIAKEAHMQADVEASAIVVEGEVKGNLSASDRIAGKLVVDEGASLVGHVSVGPDVAKRTGRPSPAPVGINRPTPPAPTGNANPQQK